MSASWQARVAVFVVRRRVKPVLGDMSDIARVRRAFGAPLPAPGGVRYRQDMLGGVPGVAAPVLNGRGRTLAAISVTVPRSRMDSRRRQELRELVVAAARSISERCREEAVEAE